MKRDWLGILSTHFGIFPTTKNMKGIILAGGEGTRLLPMTKVTNKHLLPVYDKPMVYYPIQTLIGAGVTDLIVVVGGQYAGDFIKVLKNGEDFGLNSVSYVYQEGSGGIAHALSLTKSFFDENSYERFLVMLGDNIITNPPYAEINNFNRDGIPHECAQIFTKAVPDPERFGVLFRNDDRSPWRIIEKPEGETTSNEAVIGLYSYDPAVFKIISKLTPSKRGELEITDVNEEYLQQGKLSCCQIKGDWIDCGTPDSLAKATNLAMSNKL